MYSNGGNATSTPKPSVSTPKPSGNPLVRLGQQHAINFTGHTIAVDGLVGKETNRMKARVLQHAINLDYKRVLMKTEHLAESLRQLLALIMLKREKDSIW